MFALLPPSCRLALATFAVVAGNRAMAQLAAKSPFVPPQGTAGNTPTAGAPLEYRGYIATGEGTQYRIYDPARKMGTWVKLNERDATFDVVAKKHGDDHQTLTIEHQGQTLTLAERKSKIVSAGSASAQALPGPAVPAVQPAPSNVPTAVTQAVVLNPSPADEQRRLEAVASEVARRRALREQATQQVGQGAPAPVNVPQPGRSLQPPGGFQQQNSVPPGPAPNPQAR